MKRTVKRTEWKPEEVALLQSLWADHSFREIMPLLPNHSHSAARAMAHRLGIKKDYAAKAERGVRNTLSPDRAVMAFEPDGIKEFGSAREAAEHYGIKVQNVRNLIESAGTTVTGVGFNYMV